MLAYFMRFLMPRSSCTTCIYICKFKKCNIPNMTLLLIVSKIYKVRIYGKVLEDI